MCVCVKVPSKLPFENYLEFFSKLCVHESLSIFKDSSSFVESSCKTQTQEIELMILFAKHEKWNRWEEHKKTQILLQRLQSSSGVVSMSAIRRA